MSQTAISNNTLTDPVAKPAEYQNIDDQNSFKVKNDINRMLEVQTSFQNSAKYDPDNDSKFKSTGFNSEGDEYFFLAMDLPSVNELEGKFVQ